MKRIFTIAAALLMATSVWAQAPEKMSYQAVIRDAGNSLTTNQAVGMQISILQGSANGTSVYTETQTPTTNANGLVSLEIGTGTIISGDFTTVDWTAGPYFIKTETDPIGGTTYTITGTSQLMSVPYALYAKTSGSSTPGPTGSTGATGSQGIQGIAGNDGAVGPQGPIGLTGPAGNDGVDGIDGAVGATGSQGIQGIAGNDGAVGPQGPIGLTGPPGNDGVDGAVGATGSQGIQGIAGNDGAVGPQGPIGLTGPPGNDGVDGAVGATGSQGIQGLTGAAGAVGATGSQGIQGLTGAAGAVGATGSQGIQGLTGLAGATGSVGATGATGATGAQGIQGIVGNDGAVGATGATGPAGGAGPFELGKDTLGGIVYYIYIGSDNLQHGLIVSKTESAAVWQASGTLTGANRTEDGAYNTGLMTSSAAATYVTGLGAGWYLPSIDELGLLYYNRYSAQKALRAGGFTLLSTAFYWSSREANASNAFYFSFGYGSAFPNLKSNTFSVRGVRAF